MMSSAWHKMCTADLSTIGANIITKTVQAMQREYKAVTDEEKKEVVELGGLHVVGTERHEARRVDNQLRGRSGRYLTKNKSLILWSNVHLTSYRQLERITSDRDTNDDELELAYQHYHHNMTCFSSHRTKAIELF